MANNAIKISSLTACTAPKSVDLVLVLSKNVASNTFTNKKTSVTEFLNISSNSVTLAISSIPGNTNPSGFPEGKFIYANGDVFIVVANNKIKKVTTQDY